MKALVGSPKTPLRGPLGGFGALPPVNAYAPGMRCATQNGPAENQKKQNKNNANKSKRKP